MITEILVLNKITVDHDGGFVAAESESIFDQFEVKVGSRKHQCLVVKNKRSLDVCEVVKLKRHFAVALKAHGIDVQVQVVECFLGFLKL